MNTCKIVSIKSIGVKKVRNLTVKNNHTIITDSGIPTHNCDRISANASDSLKGILDNSSTERTWDQVIRS